MTDRVQVLTVILDREFRDDDVEAVMKAIQMVKGVREVQPHIKEHGDYLAYSSARRDLEERLWKALREEP